MRLTLKLGPFIVENDLGELLAAPADVILSRYDVVQPDLLFISNVLCCAETEPRARPGGTGTASERAC